jgi:hypothetical protein
VTRLTAIDPKNIIGFSDEGERSRPDTPPTSSAPPSSYSLRNRNSKQSSLKYDVKYHPLDEAIRPSQAAKRRSAHGEAIQPLLSDDSDEANSSPADLSGDSDEEEESEEVVEKKPEPVSKGKKRTRRPSAPLEPTRRSSRRTADTKVSYDMSVHPQDRDLIVLSSDEEEEDGVPIAKRKRLSNSTARKSKSQGRDANVVGSDSDASELSNEVLSSVEGNNGGATPGTAEIPGKPTSMVAP